MKRRHQISVLMFLLAITGASGIYLLARPKKPAILLEVKDSVTYSNVATASAVYTRYEEWPILSGLTFLPYSLRGRRVFENLPATKGVIGLSTRQIQGPGTILIKAPGFRDASLSPRESPVWLWQGPETNVFFTVIERR